MNYLAHAYLSFKQPEILVGNLISDFVKGKTKFHYPPNIQKGIALHRAIDAFTDSHHSTHMAKEVFKPFYRLYSAPFTDVVYDHFLACDKNEFSSSALFEFSQNTYDTLEDYQSTLPPQFQFIFPYMKQHNWLFNYQHRWGIERSFNGIVRRATYLKESETAFILFEKNYDAFRQCYEIFFPSLKTFAFSFMQTLLNNKDENPENLYSTS